MKYLGKRGDINQKMYNQLQVRLKGYETDYSENKKKLTI